jgi:hypothetical protein
MTKFSRRSTPPFAITEKSAGVICHRLRDTCFNAGLFFTKATLPYHFVTTPLRHHVTSSPRHFSPRHFVTMERGHILAPTAPWVSFRGEAPLV